MSLQLKKKEMFYFHTFISNIVFSGIELSWKMKFFLEYIFNSISSLNNLLFWPKGWTQNLSRIITGQQKSGKCVPLLPHHDLGRRKWIRAFYSYSLWVPGLQRSCLDWDSEHVELIARAGISWRCLVPSRHTHHPSGTGLSACLGNPWFTVP